MSPITATALVVLMTIDEGRRSVMLRSTAKDQHQDKPTTDYWPIMSVGNYAQTPVLT
jgi:hypothetical protein